MFDELANTERFLMKPLAWDQAPQLGLWSEKERSEKEIGERRNPCGGLRPPFGPGYETHGRDETYVCQASHENHALNDPSQFKIVFLACYTIGNPCEI